MRNSFLKFSSSPNFIAFATANWIFLGFLLSSVILLLITIAFMFGGISEVWEKRCAKLLLFCVVPVFAWLIYFLRPGFSPYQASVLVWGLMGLTAILNRVKHNSEDRKALARMEGWRCQKCRHINQKLYRVCSRCGFKKPE